MDRIKNSRRRLLIVTIGIAGTLVMTLAGIHFYVKWSVNRWKTRMAAQGEKFEVKDCLEPRAAAADNGYSDLIEAANQIPRSMTVLELMPSSLPLAAPGKAIPIRALTNWTARRGSSPGKGGTNATWPILNDEMARFNPLLGDARTALRHHVLDASLDYHAGFGLRLPHLGQFNRVAQWLELSALHDLRSGKSADALENLQALLALIRGMENEPLVISQLYRIKWTRVATSLTWQCLQAPDLSDAQFAGLQQSWRALEFIGAMERSLLLSRATEEETIQRCRESRDSFVQVLHGWRGAPPSTPGSASLSDLIEETPRRAKEGVEYLIWDWYWSYTDELRTLQINQLFIDSARLARSVKSFAAAQSNTVTGLKALGYAASPGDSDWRGMPGEGTMVVTLFSKVALGLENTLRKVMTAETLCNLATTAVALKRFQQQQGRPPGSLSELVPAFLASVTIDPMDGQALRYQPKSSGDFLLYSIGDDRRDDGGDPTTPSKTSESKDSWSDSSWNRGRDWVWPMPASAAEIRDHNAKE